MDGTVASGVRLQKWNCFTKESRGLRTLRMINVSPWSSENSTENSTTCELPASNASVGRVSF